MRVNQAISQSWKKHASFFQHFYIEHFFHWKVHLKIVSHTEQSKHTGFEYSWVKCEFILSIQPSQILDLLFRRPAPSFILQPSDRRLWSTECELSCTPDFFFSYRLCIQTMLLYFLHPNPPEESWSSLMGFWLFAETMCCCAEGCKVNLDVFEVGVVPHWLSLSSLIAFFISSRSRSLTPRISCTLAHISALWTVTKAFWGLPLYFFFALPLFDLC